MHAHACSIVWVGPVGSNFTLDTCPCSSLSSYSITREHHTAMLGGPTHDSAYSYSYSRGSNSETEMRNRMKAVAKFKFNSA